MRALRWYFDMTSRERNRSECQRRIRSEHKHRPDAIMAEKREGAEMQRRLDKVKAMGVASSDGSMRRSNSAFPIIISSSRRRRSNILSLP